MISPPLTHIRQSVKKIFHFITNIALRITIHATYSHLTNLLVQKNTHCLIKKPIDGRLNVTNFSWRIRGAPHLPGASDVDREVWKHVFKYPNVDLCFTRLSVRKTERIFRALLWKKPKMRRKIAPKIEMKIFMRK